MLEIIFAIEAGLALGLSIYNFCELLRVNKQIDSIYRQLIHIRELISADENCIEGLQNCVGGLQKHVFNLLGVEDPEDESLDN